MGTSPMEIDGLKKTTDVSGDAGPRPRWGREAILWGLALAAGTMSFSIVLGESVLGLTLLAGLIWVVRERPRVVHPQVTLAAGVYALWALLSLLVGAESGGWGKSPRLIWLLALPLTAMAVRTRRDFGLILAGFALGSGILALRVLIENPLVAGRVPEAFMARLIDQGSMTAGQILMVGCVLSVGLWASARAEGHSGRGWMMLAVLVALALAVNLKRGSWICAFLMLAFFFSRRLGWKTWGWMALFAALLLLLPAARQRLAELPREFDADRGGRMTMWTKIAPELMRRHPWGIGYSALTNRLMRDVAPEVELNRNHLHSNPVQVAVELGWLGLGIYLVWMLAVMKQARRVLRVSGGDWGVWAAVLAVAGLIANGLVEYNLGDTELMVISAILWGLLSAGLPSHSAVRDPGGAA